MSAKAPAEHRDQRIYVNFVKNILRTNTKSLASNWTQIVMIIAIVWLSLNFYE